MKKRRIELSSLPVIACVLIFAWGCATKRFVVQEVADIDRKVEEANNVIEANQTRLKEHDVRLATIADLISRHDSQFEEVDAEIDEVKNAVRGQLVSKVTVRGGDAKFGFDSFQLTPKATAVIDGFILKLIEENKGVFLEIQGHTDSTGPEEYNLALGKKRAEAVREYLYVQRHIPLHRMEVISLGSSKPIAENSTREGRSLNRRVEILVYE